MIVVDSSVIVAYYNKLDTQHARGKAFMQELHRGSWGQALLAEYAFIEIANVLLARCGYEACREACDVLESAKEFNFVPALGYFDRSLNDFRLQESRKLSLVDCALAALAREKAQGLLATFDGALRVAPGIVAIG